MRKIPKFTKEQQDIIEKVFQKYEINTPKRKREFMATLHHESQGFTRFTENLNYSAEGLLKIFKHDFDLNKDKVYSESEMLKAINLQRNPVAIANFVYANQNGNGNEASGDGWRHRGMGAIMLTGKGIQLEYFKYINKPFTAETLNKFEYAMDSAGWYWSVYKNLNLKADKGDTKGIRKIVNGGLIGYADVVELVKLYATIYK